MYKHLFAFLVLGLAALSAQPTVYSLTFNPTQLQTSALPATVTATVRIFNNNPALDGFIVFLDKDDFSSSTSEYLEASTSDSTVVTCPATLTGGECRQYEVPIFINEILATGNYLPRVLLYYDKFANSIFLDRTELVAAGITANFTLLAASVDPPSPACSVAPVSGGSPILDIADTTPPELVGSSLCINPIEVDVRNSGATVAVSFRVRDNLSGFNSGQLYFESPNTGQFDNIQFTSSSRTSGNEWDGTYTVNWRIPTGSTAGTWKIKISLVDRASNTNFVNNPANAATPSAPAAVLVVSNPDSTPPKIESVTFSPNVVDVTQASQVVTVRLRITDTGSGLKILGFSSGLWIDGPRAVPFNARQILSDPISGNANDGIYEMRFTIPRYSRPGQWRISNLDLVDNANNRLSGNLNFNSSALPTDTFTVISPIADTTAPQITSLSISPGFVNVTASSQPIVITATVTDNLSGIGSFGCSVNFASPSGNQVQFGSFSRTSGDKVRGVYQANITLPQFSETGTWRPVRLSCFDEVYNQSLLSSRDEILARFPAAKIDVAQPSNLPDGSLNSSSSPTIVSDTGSQVQITFPPNSVPGPTSIAIDLLSQPPNIPAPSGFTLGTGFVNVDLTPKPTSPFPAPGVTIEIPLTSQMEPGSVLRLFRVDPATGRLVAAPKVNPPGGQVTGIVGPTGLTATFTGVSGFSTVVGLFEQGRPGDLNSDGQVNCADIRLIQDSWNKRQGQFGFDSRADFNRDRIVNLFDLAQVSRYLPRNTRCF